MDCDAVPPRPRRPLGPVIDGLRAAGLRVERIGVPYEFQRGGDEMLRVW